MKRKEALYKIKSILDNTDKCGNNLKAQIVLMELERLGMLPPKIERLRKEVVMGDFVEWIEQVNEWENE